jgi:hypothetical protein
MTYSSILNRLRSQSACRRWSVASRTLAAVVGGYAVTTLLNLAVPLLFSALGAGLPQALASALMASFLIWAVIVMAAFHARSAARAWAWLIGAAIPLGLVVWFLLPGVKP